MCPKHQIQQTTTATTEGFNVFAFSEESRTTAQQWNDRLPDPCFPLALIIFTPSKATPPAPPGPRLGGSAYLRPF